MANEIMHDNFSLRADDIHKLYIYLCSVFVHMLQIQWTISLATGHVFPMLNRKHSPEAQGQIFMRKFVCYDSGY